MWVSHQLVIPAHYSRDIIGYKFIQGCWLFASPVFQPSYWMMLKREGFSGDLVSNSTELEAVTMQLDRAQLGEIYHLVYNTYPDHFFDYSLRNDIEHMVLSGTIKVFYLNEDQAFRLSNPNDVLWSSPASISMNTEDPIAANRHRLAEELGKDIVKRWANKDAEDHLHINRFALWRECYEAMDVSVELFDTVYDFIVGLKDIVVFVAELSYDSYKTHIRVHKTLLEFTYKGAVGDIEGIKADINALGIEAQGKIDSAKELLALAEKGKQVFDTLASDPLTRTLIYDYLDSLYQSIPYRQSRTIMVRIAFEIGLEVLLALATAGIATAARRGAQTGKLAATTAKITRQAKRIGPFTKHAIDLMVDLAKALNKPVKVEEIKPVAKLQLPDYGKLNELELRAGGDKVRTTAPESNPNTAAVREGESVPDSGVADEFAALGRIAENSKANLTLHQKINLRGEVIARRDAIKTPSSELFLGGTKRGPVLGGIKDTRTGETFYGLNTENITNFHPQIADRLTGHTFTHANNLQGVPHAEVVALNKALLSRGSNTTADLSEFLNFNARFSPNKSTNIVRCSDCRVITSGVQSLSDNF